jgi:copper chaperone
VLLGYNIYLIYFKFYKRGRWIMGLFGTKGETIVINVKGMSCNHCKISVETALKKLNGVSKAVVDLDKGNER